MAAVSSPKWRSCYSDTLADADQFSDFGDDDVTSSGNFLVVIIYRDTN